MNTTNINTKSQPARTVKDPKKYTLSFKTNGDTIKCVRYGNRVATPILNEWVAKMSKAKKGTSLLKRKVADNTYEYCCLGVAGEVAVERGLATWVQLNYLNKESLVNEAGLGSSEAISISAVADRVNITSMGDISGGGSHDPRNFVERIGNPGGGVLRQLTSINDEMFKEDKDFKNMIKVIKFYFRQAPQTKPS